MRGLRAVDPTPWSLRLAILAVLLVGAALLPGSALAQSGGSAPESGCDATVKSTQDPSVAAIDVDCQDQGDIKSVDFSTSQSGRISPNSGTTCRANSNRSFTCQPQGSDTVISVRFKSSGGDVCDPRLQADFSVTTETGDGSGDIKNVKASGCSGSSSGGSGSGGGSDSGGTPRGGIDSGAGGTAPSATGSPSAASLGIAALTVVLLGAGGLIVRRARKAS